MTDADRPRPPRLSRRHVLRCGAAWASAALPPTHGLAEPPQPADAPEPYLTPPEEFQDVSRGNPRPYALPEATKRQVGLTRDTWRLEVVSDPDHPATLGRQLTKADGTALDFDGLLRLG